MGKNVYISKESINFVQKIKIRKAKTGSKLETLLYLFQPICYHDII